MQFKLSPGLIYLTLVVPLHIFIFQGCQPFGILWNHHIFKRGKKRCVLNPYGAPYVPYFSTALAKFRGKLYWNYTSVSMLAYSTNILVRRSNGGKFNDSLCMSSIMFLSEPDHFVKKCKFRELNYYSSKQRLIQGEIHHFHVKQIHTL